MNEFEELKKKISEIFILIRSVIFVSFKKDALGDQFKKNPGLKKRLVIAAFLSIGLFAYVIYARFAGGPGLEGQFFASGKAEGDLVLSDFESIQSLEVWEFSSASLEISKENAYAGLGSGRVILKGSAGTSGISIEDVFTQRKKLADWSTYEALRFFVLNPGPESERLIIQIKDQWDRSYKQDLILASNEAKNVEILTENLAKTLNLKKIGQIMIFRWDPRVDREFYFDDFRLVKPVWEAGAAAAGSGTFKAGRSRPVKMLDYGFAVKKDAWKIPDGEGGVTSTIRVPFLAGNETGAPCFACAVEGGVPFPMGEIKTTENTRILGTDGTLLPFQGRVLSRWPDGTIQWLGVHFEASLPPAGTAGFFLEYGPEIKNPEMLNPTLKVTQSGDDDSVSVNTGPMKVVLSKKNFYLYEKILTDQNRNGLFEAGEEISAKAPLMIKFRGKEYRADLDNKTYKIEVEEEGALRAVIKASGWFQAEDGGRFCQLTVRYYFYLGKSYFKIAHTLIYTGYPENKYYEPYQKFKLPANETVQSFGLRVPYKFSEPSQTRVLIGRFSPEVFEFSGLESFRMAQLGWERAKINNVVAQAMPTDFYAGWMTAADTGGGLTVAVRDFRETFPKAIAFDAMKSEIAVDLWPEEAGEMDLATTKEALGPEDYARGNAFGLAKTHEMLFYFHGADPNAAQAPAKAYSFMERALIRNNPYWVDATGALGRLYPYDEKYGGQEKILERIFDWAQRHPKMFKWYGMLDFGDTLTWFRGEDDSKTYSQVGWNPEGRWGWYNCEGVGTHTGALLQFVRSGIWPYFEFGENLSRHLMDVDTVHYDTISNDKRLKKLDPIMSQPGSMHRHSANHWSGRSDEASHTSVVGILLYHYLTGDERARDVALEIGEFFLKEPFTYVGHPDIAPHRGMANALWGEVLLYQTTGDERYKKAADKIVDIYLAGQQADGSFYENYNPQNGTWSGEKHALYMEGYVLGAFKAYHELTQDPDVQAMFLKALQFLSDFQYSVPVTLHAHAYAYLITRDPVYVRTIEKALPFLVSHQQASRDPMMDGLIYSKPIYHRPMAFLSTLPYAFGALEEDFTMSQMQEQQSQRA